MYPSTEEEYDEMQGHDLVRLSEDHGYKTSRDYGLLWDIATHTAVVCFLDFRTGIRDVACTSFYRGTLEISSRGMCYVYAEDKEELRMRCIHLDLEFIEPTEL